MIKIKFRGKALYTDKVIKGDLITPHCNSRPYMIKSDVNESIVPVAVDEDSLQMFWREDKNGAEIYEGDTIRLTQFLFGSEVFELPLEAKVGRNQDGFTLKVTKSIFTEINNEDNMEVSVALFSGLNGDDFELTGRQIKEENIERLKKER